MKKFVILFGLLIFLVMLLSLLNYIPLVLGQINNNSVEEVEEEESETAMFKSDNLGIYFNYGFPNEISFVEVDNRIYIKTKGGEVSNNPFIEVFLKGEDEVFKDVVFEFIDGDNCEVVIPKQFVIQNGYEAYEISKIDSSGSGCGVFGPSDEEEFDSSYFLYNPEVSGKFVFIDNGQDYLPSNSEAKGLLASETIEIVK